MNLVLLSGGSGKRLWPLSGGKQAKQFIKILQDERGNEISMCQRVFAQTKRNIPEVDITVATNEKQVDE